MEPSHWRVVNLRYLIHWLVNEPLPLYLSIKLYLPAYAQWHPGIHLPWDRRRSLHVPFWWNATISLSIAHYLPRKALAFGLNTRLRKRKIRQKRMQRNNHGKIKEEKKQLLDMSENKIECLCKTDFSNMPVICFQGFDKSSREEYYGIVLY